MRDHPRGRVRDGRANCRPPPERDPHADAANPSRRRRMSRSVLGLLVVLTLVGCTTAAHTKSVSAQSIALQPGDVSGLVKCALSGDIQTVIRREKSNDQAAASQYAAEWEQWKTQGATEAYFAAYGQTSTDCDALSTIGTGAPTD